MAMKESADNALEFYLDPKSGVPYYKQIIQQIEMAIADGRLVSGSQLPTVRGLAVDLQVNPNTVARAYSQLEIRGIVNTQQGTGTFISDKEITIPDVEREKILSSITQSYLIKLNSFGFTIEEAISYLQEMKLHDSEEAS